MGSLDIRPFQTTLAVPLQCDGCIKDVSGAVKALNGITKVEADLKNQLVFIEGTASPSSIVSAIESTGRDAILRGSGKSNSAGVCILETHSTQVSDKVQGLARMVEVSSGLTLVDLTIKGLSPGTYHATVRETGDISQGAASTGGVWEAIKAVGGFDQVKGEFGTIDVGKDGRGSVFSDRPVSISEMIGRSMVISKNKVGPFEREDPNTLVGSDRKKRRCVGQRQDSMFLLWKERLGRKERAGGQGNDVK